MNLDHGKETKSKSERFVMLVDLWRAHLDWLSSYEEEAMEAALLSQSAPESVEFSKIARVANAYFMAAKEKLSSPIAHIA